MGFWLSKLLPQLLYPLGLSLLLQWVALLNRRRRWAPAVSAGGLLLLTVPSLPLVSDALLRPLEQEAAALTPAAIPQADAIVVLSGGRHAAPGDARIIEWHDPDRFLAGVDLFMVGRAPRLLFTGGQSPFHPGLPPEGRLYLNEAEGLGIPASAMASTGPVVNTAEEAVAIRALLPRPQNRVLLVTSAYHMQRARRLFERQGFEVLAFPADFKTRGSWSGGIWQDPMQWFPSAANLQASSVALRECLGRLVYRAW